MAEDDDRRIRFLRRQILGLSRYKGKKVQDGLENLIGITVRRIG